MKKLNILCTSLALLSLCIANATGVTLRDYTADAATKGPNNFPDLDPFGPRLFTGTSGTNRAPLNSVVWFLSSTNSLLTLNPANGFGPGGVLTADDTLLFSVPIVGVNDPFFGPELNAGGYITRSVEAGFDPLGFGPGETLIPAVNLTKNIYVCLWNALDSTPNDFVPTAGTTYGLLSLGVRPVPDLGNSDWSITENIYSGHYLLTSGSENIPEPSSFALLGLGLLGLIGCRRFTTKPLPQT